MKPRVVVALLVSATLSGCGGGSDRQDFGVTDPDEPQCQGTPVSQHQIESGPPASSLPESAQQAFIALTSVRQLDTYRVLENKSGHLTIGKPLPEDADESGFPGPTPVNFQMSTIQSSNSGGESSHGWWYVSDSNCELERTFTGLSPADVWLDAEFPTPRRGDTAVHFLVSERACASGEPAGKRIQVAELVRDATQVRVAIAVKPQSGAFRCPGNPAEPFTVHLDSPLGDEQIVDSAAYPARAFAAAGGGRLS